MNISAVLFDVGGVLVELNGLPSLAQLLDSEQSLDEIYKYWMSSPSVIAHETGKLSSEDFAVEVVKDLKLDLAPDAFMENFATWIVDVFPDTFALIEAIPSHVKVAALSNTSPAHWIEVEKTGLTDKIEHLFLSHEIGHLKPDAPAFQAAIDGLNMPAEQVIFFDDNIDNVQAAKDFGLLAHQALNPSEAKSILIDYSIV